MTYNVFTRDELKEIIDYKKKATACLGSKRRMNKNRHISAITPIPRFKYGYKCDLVFRQYDNGHNTSLEFGGREAKLIIEGGFGSKFLQEGFLNLSFIQKDMLDVLLEKVGYDDLFFFLRTVGFIHSGLSCTMVELDRPTSYISRVSRGNKIKISNSVLNFGSTVLPATLSSWICCEIIKEILDIILSDKEENPNDTSWEGFFLGVLSFRKALTCDDSHDHPFETREDYIIIHGYQILTEKPYDDKGTMMKNLIKSQQEEISSIVGYFKFKRQADVTLSARDRLWMKSYANNVPHGCIAIINSDPNLFDDKSTHTYKFAFWDMTDPVNTLPIQIINMSDDTSSFKSFMSNAPYKLPLSSRYILHTCFHIPSAETMIEQYDAMYTQAMSSLKEATNKVIDKERELQYLKDKLKSHKER
ncbi:hypothetical protein INT48_008154 [Thamnidium elegans]|uniref:Uncharacterized protein n=1 Tax=Thamnidium elegans TaxID=101142 RepID=A0A8H7VWQ8_9FUNG|nr:hypothetical protein INT48_008154 [Thamnidium elegans]